MFLRSFGTPSLVRGLWFLKLGNLLCTFPKGICSRKFAFNSIYSTRIDEIHHLCSCNQHKILFEVFVAMINQSGGVSKHLKDVPSQITCRLLNLELKVICLPLLPLMFYAKQSFPVSFCEWEHLYLLTFVQSKKDFVYALLLLEPEPNVRRFNFVHIFPLNRLFSWHFSFLAWFWGD